MTGARPVPGGYASLAPYLIGDAGNVPPVEIARRVATMAQSAA